MACRKIYVVDDHPLCAAAVGSAVADLPGRYEVEGLGAIRDLSVRVGCGDIALILLDLRLPDSTGFRGIAAARALFPDVPVCVFSAQSDANTVRQAMAMGAAGFLAKTLPFKDLAASIAALLEGQVVVPPAAPGAVLAGGDANRFSPAELRIMQCLSLGLQNKQIAFELGLSQSTVKSHLAHIFMKLRVTNRSQAILAFDRLRDLRPEPRAAAPRAPFEG